MRSPRQMAAAALQHLLSPLVPDRKRLPFLYWLHLLNGACGPELTQVDRFFVGKKTAIDVGANDGLFTYRLSKYFQHVYSFEINPDLARPIAQYDSGNVKLHSCGLSSNSRTARFYVPVVDGRTLNGWGSLDRANLPGAKTFVEKDVQVRPLDDFGFNEVDFIKIDVEGHEADVLKGATATIERSRPILLIEVRDENLPVISAWFRDHDFRQFSLAHIFHLKEDNSNYVFVPEEKLSQLAIGPQQSGRPVAGKGAATASC